ncbi:MAG: phage major capsid protein, partial [Ruminococcus sp.]|nr:phage major capsid protein [Ruminococcus sp.]
AEEGRPMTAEELATVNDCNAQIDAFDATIEAARSTKMKATTAPDGSLIVVDTEAAAKQAEDIKNVISYLRERKEDALSNATQMKQSGNGAVIPVTIVDKIIDKVKEISPLYNFATKYTDPGDLKITVVDTSTDDVTIDFVDDELDAPDSHVPSFTTITLSGYVYRAIALVSKKLVNNAAFDLVIWLVTYFSKKIAAFYERHLIGSAAQNAKVKGILGSYDSANMKVTTASKSAITGDELIDLQELIPDAYQGNGVFIMNRATRKAIRKLKDLEGRYLLNFDPTMPFGVSLLGKPIYLTENLDDIGTANGNLIIYGDISGLAVKEPGSFEIQPLYERYADQGAIGINLYGEMDAKVEDKQKIAVLVAAAA